MFLATGAIAGLAALGALNAARVILGPFNVIALGAMGFAGPEGARIWQRTPLRLAMAMRALGAVLTIAALACVGLALALPPSLARRLAGPTWTEARPLLLLTGIWVAAF